MLLSRYTAIAVIGFEEDAVAVTWTGDPTVAPEVGDETEMPANAAEASASNTGTILNVFLKAEPPKGGIARTWQDYRAWL